MVISSLPYTSVTRNRPERDQRSWPQAHKQTRSPREIGDDRVSPAKLQIAVGFRSPEHLSVALHQALAKLRDLSCRSCDSETQRRTRLNVSQRELLHAADGRWTCSEATPKRTVK